MTGAHGSLTDADIAGVDSITANGRADTVVVGLRDALGNAAEHDLVRNVIQRWFNRDEVKQDEPVGRRGPVPVRARK